MDKEKFTLDEGVAFEVCETLYTLRLEAKILVFLVSLIIDDKSTTNPDRLLFLSGSVAFPFGARADMYNGFQVIRNDVGFEGVSLVISSLARCVDALRIRVNMQGNHALAFGTLVAIVEGAVPVRLRINNLSNGLDFSALQHVRGISMEVGHERTVWWNGR